MSTVNRSDLTSSAARWRDAVPGGPSIGAEDPGGEGDARRRSMALGDGIEARASAATTWLAWPPEPSTPGASGRLSGEQIVDDLLRWEGSTRHLYRDTRGHVTVGIGNLVPSAAAAMELPFVDVTTGKLATRGQIAAAFSQVSARPAGMAADAYASTTALRLPPATVRELAVERLDREFLPALRRQFSGFDTFPAAAQRALVDMIYNLGSRGLSRFENLKAACESGDWAGAAAECSRSSSRPARNEWTRSMFLQAAASRPR